MAQATLIIDGKVMPCPSSLVWTIEDYDLDSSRSAITGELTRARICSKEKIDLEWKAGALSTEEVSLLLRSISPVFVQVQYFSPLAGDYVTKTMYCGNRDIDFYRVIDGVPQYGSIKFSLIER